MRSLTACSLAIASLLLVACGDAVVPTALSGVSQVKPNEDSLYIRQHYTKIERMVPMRDGVKLLLRFICPKILQLAKTTRSC